MTKMGSKHMALYIYMERNGIHIINPYKTAAKIEEFTANEKLLHLVEKNFIRSHKKKTSKDIVAEKAKAANMPITERWPGGMLTNL
jgi:small subunit ribosomal protein S2